MKSIRTLKALHQACGNHDSVLIAEAGTNHNGNLKTARCLIDAAAEAGAAMVKFQWVIAREILHPNTGLVRLPGGDIPLFEKFRSLERPPSFYRALSEHCRKRGVVFLCSPFGLESASLLGKLDPAAIKVASPELTFLPLLEDLADRSHPLLLSTGVTTLSDLDWVRKVLRHHGRSRTDSLWLHCITQYPARESEYNLLLLATLAKRTGFQVGLSDHTLDPHFLPHVAFTVSALMGQPLWVEKHFTLDKKGTGLDDRIAVDPVELTGLAVGLTDLSRRSREFLKRERHWAADFRRLLKTGGQPLRTLARSFAVRMLPEYDPKRIVAALGDGIKELAPGESPHYTTTNRSLRAIRAIKTGERLQSTNTAWLRSEKNLQPGLPAREAGRLKNARALHPIADGDAIASGDFT